jgi:ParB family chromosome partitioning protein
MNGMEKEIVEVALDDIIPNRFQPRLSFDEKGLNELAESIRQHGIIQPLVLRKVADKYEIIAGERRYKASYIAGLTKVPAVVINLNDNESAEVAIVENIQRRDLSPIEEAKSYKKLLDRGYLTQDQLASRMGKTQATVSNKLRLLNLDEKVQEALLNNKISERHARSILRLPNSEEQQNVLNEIIEKRLNVRDTEKLISEKLGEENNNFVSVSNISNLVNEKETEEKNNESSEPIEFPQFINSDDQIKNINEEKSVDLDNFFVKDDNLNSQDNSANEEEIETLSDFISPVGSVTVDNSLNDTEEVLGDNFMPFNEIKDRDINIVINKVKNLVSEINSIGFNVKLEEYDFDELYQFTIKVDRN